MAVYFATGGRVQLTSDQVRTLSGVSCVPGVHSASGGLFIGDVIRVADRYRVVIDYGATESGYIRWPAPEAALRLGDRWCGIFLGDYDALITPSRDWRAPGSRFFGDHSAFAHDYRAGDKTVCWHDPLRTAPIRLPMSVLLAYWQKSTSPVRGFAGWVRDNRLPDTSTEEPEVPIPAVFSAASGVAISKTTGSAFDYITRRPRSFPAAYRRNVIAQARILLELSPSLPKDTEFWVTTYDDPDRLEFIRKSDFTFTATTPDLSDFRERAAGNAASAVRATPQ